MNSAANCSRMNNERVSSFSRSRVISSSAPKGSSKRNSGGFRVRVRAMEARMRMPPESALG